ncbi:cysteine proteinase inhibitor B [Humulus lupulus]|uniref:cysteine proteinase inhibitor B n=1 Tax=Humulus lupulus TaxID=3486 RepID=UPI002B40B0A0|nr:cysteine proteinase inhibitor B [Humulus lupulus]
MALLNSPAAKLAIVTVLLSLLVATTSGYGGPGQMVGGRTDIEDVKTNKEVQELGQFSVEEHNRSLIRTLSRRAGNGGAVGELKFSEVVEAQKQVVSGIKYYLKVSAVAKSGEQRVFDSVVVVKPWMQNSRELLNFAPSTDRDVHF